MVAVVGVVFPGGNSEMEKVVAAAASDEGGGGVPAADVGPVCDASQRLCDWPGRVDWFGDMIWAATSRRRPCCCGGKSRASLAGNASRGCSARRAGMQTGGVLGDLGRRVVLAFGFLGRFLRVSLS